MKYENGKPKFIAIPASIALESMIKSTETPDNLSGKEFETRILKDNKHDLDDDLPAPYNIKQKNTVNIIT